MILPVARRSSRSRVSWSNAANVERVLAALARRARPSGTRTRDPRVCSERSVFATRSTTRGGSGPPTTRPCPRRARSHRSRGTCRTSDSARSRSRARVPRVNAFAKCHWKNGSVVKRTTSLGFAIGTQITSVPSSGFHGQQSRSRRSGSIARRDRDAHRRHEEHEVGLGRDEVVQHRRAGELESRRGGARRRRRAARRSGAW